MPSWKLKEWSGQRPTRRMRDAEVGREARADEFRGFGSTRFTLEESQEEPGDHLRNGFSVKYFFSLHEVERDAYLGCLEITGSQLPQCLRKVLHPLLKLFLNLFSEIRPERAGVLPLSSELKTGKTTAWDDWTEE